jgi:hypothetical protein
MHKTWAQIRNEQTPAERMAGVSLLALAGIRPRGQWLLVANIPRSTLRNREASPLVLVSRKIAA